MVYLRDNILLRKVLIAMWLLEILAFLTKISWFIVAAVKAHILPEFNVLEEQRVEIIVFSVLTTIRGFCLVRFGIVLIAGLTQQESKSMVQEGDAEKKPAQIDIKDKQVEIGNDIE